MAGSLRSKSQTRRGRPSSDASACVAKRVDLCCERIGLAAPPASVHIRLFRMAARENGWTLTAHTAPGKAPGVAQWFTQWDPQTLKLASGVAPTSMRLEFIDLPGPWGTFANIAVDHLIISPAGTLTFVVEDQPEQVASFLDRLQETVPQEELRVRDYLGNDDAAGITHRQLDVISVAVALGYYEVPRRVDLRTLAARIGVSLGTASELIRRGEAFIISSYVDTLSGNFATSCGETEGIAQDLKEALLAADTSGGFKDILAGSQGDIVSQKVD